MPGHFEEAHTDAMAGDAELEAAGFRQHHVDAWRLNIVHPQDTRQLGPFCRLDVATPLEVPLQPGVYAWVTDEKVRYVGHASVLRQIVNGTRMDRAYNDYTYVPPSKPQQTSSPRVYVNGLLNVTFVRCLRASRPPADGVAQVLSSDGRRHSTIGGHISAWEEQARGGDAARRPAAE